MKDADVLAPQEMTDPASADRDRGDARVARIMSLLIVAGLTLQAVVSTLTIVAETRPWWITASIIIAVATASGGYLYAEAHVLQGHTPTLTRLTEAVMTVCVLPLIPAGVWAPLALVAALILLDPGGPRRSAAGAAIFTSLVLITDLVLGAPWYDLLAVVVVTWLIAGVLYVLGRLYVTVNALVATREEVARMHVEQERHRMSRDLHDILGRSLVAVSLRLQTATRLLPADAEAARAQLDEAVATVDQAQSGLRHLSRGAVVVDLRDEVEAASDLLDRLGIASKVSLDDSGLRPEHDEILARIVREAITNMLKHSRPTQAFITLENAQSRVRFEIANDAALPPGEVSNRAGTGLSDLSSRVRHLGGTMTAQSTPGPGLGHWYALTVELPLPIPSLHIPAPRP